MTIATMIVTLLCAVVILAYCLSVVNSMNPETSHYIRVAFIILCVAEFALLAGAVFGLKTAGHVEVMILNFAILLFAMFDHRHRRTWYNS
jgi:choline-glycine betaine transporter